MMPRLIAAQFHRTMETGRTSPILCGCEDQSGNNVGDYVVKLSGCMERRGQATLSELFASRLASHFGILIPGPALVEINSSFADLVANRQVSIARGIRDSVGLNFGSRALIGGV